MLFLCVARKYHGTLAARIGLGMTKEFVERFAKSGLERVEFHFNEENQFMDRLSVQLGGEPIKRYELYSRTL